MSSHTHPEQLVCSYDGGGNGFHSTASCLLPVEQHLLVNHLFFLMSLWLSFFDTISSPVSKKSAALTMKRRLNMIKRFRLRFESEHAGPWVTSETSTAELTVFSVCVCSSGSVLPDESTPAPPPVPVKAVRMFPAVHTGQRKRKHRVAQTVFVQGSAALVLQWRAASCWASSVSLCRTV